MPSIQTSNKHLFSIKYARQLCCPVILWQHLILGYIRHLPLRTAAHECLIYVIHSRILSACLQEFVGIVNMFGSADTAGKSVLMLAGARDRSVKLLELPTFTERGVLPDVSW